MIVNKCNNPNKNKILFNILFSYRKRWSCWLKEIKKSRTKKPGLHRAKIFKYRFLFGDGEYPRKFPVAGSAMPFPEG